MIKFKFDIKVGRKNVARTEGRTILREGSQEHDWPDDGQIAEPAPSGRVGLPGEFRNPEVFRGDLEQHAAPAPRLALPPVPTYLVLLGLLASWCYYGVQYNKRHFPVSLSALLVFFGVFILFFVAGMYFRELHRRVRLYPILKRAAVLRPGAFVITGIDVPTLYFARKTWLGKVEFEEGGEHKTAYTRLDARLKESLGRIEVRKTGLLGRIMPGSDGPLVHLPDGAFSRKFSVWSPAPGFAERFLDPTIQGAVLRLAKQGAPVLHVNGTFMRVEVCKDLSKTKREAALRQFLAEAETILGAATRETLTAPPEIARVSGTVFETARRGRGRKALLFMVLAVVLVGAVLSLEEWRFHRRFVTQTREFRDRAVASEGHPITERELDGLPEPAQRYLRFAGVVGKKKVRFARIKGAGTIRGSKPNDWRSTQAEYFVATQAPALCAYVKNEFRRIFHIAVCDRYSEGRGRANVKFLSILPLRRLSEEDHTTALFLRLLTELPMYPTAFLEGALVTWKENDALSAEMVLRDGSLEWPAVFFFNPGGAVARVELQRPTGRGQTARMEKWTQTYGEYRDFGGFKLPTRLEAAWNLKKGDVAYLKFTVREVELYE